LGAWIALTLLVAAGLVLVLRHDAGTIAGLDAADFSAIIAAAALLIFLGLPLLGRYQGRIGSAFRDLAIWSATALALIALYSYRAELFQVANRVGGELLPPGTALTVESPDPGGRAVRIRKQPDGQFVVHAKVNGANVSMIVDTGASTVVLRQDDARRIGLDLANLSYTVPVETANGTAFAARVRLTRVFVGPVGLAKVEALVAKPGVLHQSLLGMSFLSRLRSYDFSGNFLTLRS